MARSRVTLASTDAAAMDRLNPSPPITQLAGQGRAGARLPSTRTWSGRAGRRNTARRMASKLAPNIFRVSISVTEAAPIPVQICGSAHKRCAIRSRRRRESLFESSIMAARSACGGHRKTTQAATTGPANGPRPASSTPPTRPPRACSRVRSGMASVYHPAVAAAIGQPGRPTHRTAHRAGLACRPCPYPYRRRRAWHTPRATKGSYPPGCCGQKKNALLIQT